MFFVSIPTIKYYRTYIYINDLVELIDRWEKELKDYMIDYNSLYFENEIAEGLFVCVFLEYEQLKSKSFVTCMCTYIHILIIK